MRFIYVRTPEACLRPDAVRDVIEWQFDDTLDINGRDIQKALRLLHNANPTLFEWEHSPIVYKTTSQRAKVSAILPPLFPSKGKPLPLSQHRAKNLSCPA